VISEDYVSINLVGLFREICQKGLKIPLSKMHSDINRIGKWKEQVKWTKIPQEKYRPKIGSRGTCKIRDRGGTEKGLCRKAEKEILLPALISRNV